jgi:VPDSG-CTERM motif
MTGEQLVENCTKSIDIGCAADSRVVSHSLFGRHVTGRSHHFHRARDCAFRFDQSRKPEVGKMWFASLIKQNVSRFDVAMQDVVLVSVMNRARHFGDEFRRTANRDRLALCHFIELSAVDEIHAEVAATFALPDFMNWHDKWMVEAGSRFRFSTKALQMRFCSPRTQAYDFERNGAIETFLMGAINYALSAAANFFQQLVVAEFHLHQHCATWSSVGTLQIKVKSRVKIKPASRFTRFIRVHNETLSVAVCDGHRKIARICACIKITVSLTIEPNEKPEITMKTLILAAIRRSLMFTTVTASLFSIRPVQAYTVTLEQVGSNVVTTGSGPINLTGLPINPIMLSTTSILDARRGDISTGPTDVSIVDVYAAFFLTGPPNFGSGSAFLPDAGSGDLVGISIDQGLLFVPQGYVSNAALSDSMTFNNATFASLFLTPGTYVWTWGTGGNQNFTLQIGSVGVPGVPDGGSTVSLLGCALLGLAGLRRKLSC